MPLVHKNNFFNSLSIFFNYYKLTQLIKHLAKKTNNKKKIEFDIEKRKKERKRANQLVTIHGKRQKKKKKVVVSAITFPKK